MNFKQNALDQWRRKKKSELWLEWTSMPGGTTRGQIEAKKGAQLQFELFKEEAFVDDHDLHPTAKEAALSVRCGSPAGFEGSGLTKLCRSAGLCANCPDFKRPSFELTATDSKKRLSLFSPPLQQVWHAGS